MRHAAISCAILLVLTSAAPDTRAVESTTARPAAADTPTVEEKAAALLTTWKARFDEEQFNYTTAGPFVIAGNGSAKKIARYRDGTILAASRPLHATYFDKQPTEPILILLFESPGPYKRLAKKWFDDDEVPHFGFYRRRENVMLMNIATGGGTLVHELVHALMAPDFPRVPDWFNEGLASLYEQCGIDGDSIRGYVNWRAPALQEAIKDKRLRPLEELIQDPSFYDDEKVGINYAQARYLMMYLQRRELLKEFYRRFRENVAKDPTGLETLKKVLGPQSLEDFETEWRRWVLTLKFGA